MARAEQARDIRSRFASTASQAAGTTAEQVAHIDDSLAKSPAGSREWGICTECGMGRVEADEVPALLDLHRTILDTHGETR